MNPTIQPVQGLGAIHRPLVNSGRPASLAYVIELASIAAIGGFLFGFDSGVINGTVDALAQAFGTRAAATGFAVGSVLLGCAVGAFLAGALADFLGRRPTMLFNAILFLISALLTGAANSAGMFITARVLGGLGVPKTIQYLDGTLTLAERELTDAPVDLPLRLPRQ